MAKNSAIMETLRSLTMYVLSAKRELALPLILLSQQTSAMWAADAASRRHVECMVWADLSDQS